MNRKYFVAAAMLWLTFCQVEQSQETENTPTPVLNDRNPLYTLPTGAAETGERQSVESENSHQAGSALQENFYETDCTSYTAFPGDKRWVFAFPDKASRYDSYAFKVETGNYDAIRIAGRFPYARYFSLNIYDFDEGNNVDALPDYEIEPLSGHTNPYRPGADRTSTKRSFEVYLIPPGSNFTAPQDSNVIYLPNDYETISLMTRVYRPDQGRDSLGDVGVPTLTALSAESEAQCPQGGMDLDSVVRIAQNVFFPQSYIDKRDTIAGLQADRLIFTRSSGTSLFRNGDNEYLTTSIKSSGVAVVRFRIPTFENTYHGSAVFEGGSDVRYWSVCVGGTAMTQTSVCMEDDRAIVDENGVATFVIGPWWLQGITERAGFNFMRRGLVYKPVVIVRQLLEDENFEGRFSAVPPFPQEIPDDFSLADLDALDGIHAIGDFAPSGMLMSTGQYRRWLKEQ